MGQGHIKRQQIGRPQLPITNFAESRLTVLPEVSEESDVHMMENGIEKRPGTAFLQLAGCPKIWETWESKIEKELMSWV